MKNAIEKYLAKEEKYEQEKAEDQERWDNYVLTNNYVSSERADAWLTDLANGKFDSVCPK
jgi:hypothetical protein